MAPDVTALLTASGGAGMMNAWKIRPISANRLTTPAEKI
jgi:hypothetical protein